MIGVTPLPWIGLVIYYLQVSAGLEKNSFKAIHLAPTKFSGQFSQSTNDSEASNPHHHGGAHPTLRKVRSKLQRTSLIQKRGITEPFRHMKTKGPLFHHIQMRSFQDHRW